MQSQANRQFEYGFPASGYNTRPRTAGHRKKSGLATKDKKMLLMAVLFAGLIGIMVIISAAYSATINYQNNQLQREISQLEGEVESLEIDIQSSNNITVIEESASKKLGMEYADGDKCVTVRADKQPGKKFAAKLKAEAFN